MIPANRVHILVQVIHHSAMKKQIIATDVQLLQTAMTAMSVLTTVVYPTTVSTPTIPHPAMMVMPVLKLILAPAVSV